MTRREREREREEREREKERERRESVGRHRDQVSAWCARRLSLVCVSKKSLLAVSSCVSCVSDRKSRGRESLQKIETVIDRPRAQSTAHRAQRTKKIETADRPARAHAHARTRTQPPPSTSELTTRHHATRAQRPTPPSSSSSSDTSNAGRTPQSARIQHGSCYRDRHHDPHAAVQGAWRGRDVLHMIDAPPPPRAGRRARAHPCADQPRRLSRHAR